MGHFVFSEIARDVFKSGSCVLNSVCSSSKLQYLSMLSPKLNTKISFQKYAN